MSTPQKQTPTGPRRSARRTKPTIPAVEGLPNTSTPRDGSPSNPISVTNTDDQNNQSSQDAEPILKNKKRSPGAKRPKNEMRGEATTFTAENAVQSDDAHTGKAKATPVKQAYAGPTFHNSPAPSALPIPSFYSKSVPNVSTSTPTEAGKNGDDIEERRTESPEITTATMETGDQSRRESTPLDFLFEAAKRAQQTPRADSPGTRSSNISVAGDSPYTRSPAPREGDPMFPFELEGGKGGSTDIGASFATPYKDRMDQLRSTSASTGTAADLSETERKAKTEALKRLLRHSQAPRAISPSPSLPDMHNPFNARSLQPRTTSTVSPHGRPHSGPSTPAPGLQNGIRPPQYFSTIPTGALVGPNNGSPMPRPPSSHLRHVYHPSAVSSPVELSSNQAASPPLISTARKQVLRNYTPNQPNGNEGGEPRYDLRGKTPEHKSRHSTQQLEDDLRRVLKLDLASKG